MKSKPEVKVVGTERVDDPAFEAELEAQEELADREALDGTMKGFWDPSDLELVKRAAAEQGIGYMTYIKRAASAQARRDLGSERG